MTGGEASPPLPEGVKRAVASGPPSGLSFIHTLSLGTVSDEAFLTFSSVGAIATNDFPYHCRT